MERNEGQNALRAQRKLCRLAAAAQGEASEQFELKNIRVGQPVTFLSARDGRHALSPLYCVP
jgi:hypothetical protein